MRRPWQTGLLLAALAVSAGRVGSQPAADPAERLRQVLQSSLGAADRDRATRECLASLRGLTDLRRALTLPDWRDRNTESSLADVDRANRAVVADRFQQAVRGVFERREATAAGVAVEMLAEMAGAARAAGEPPGLVRAFAPDLADIVRTAPPRLRATAARALGQIDPELGVALPPLEELLQTTDPTLRKAAADGLFELLHGAAGAGPRVAAARRDAVTVACAVLPLAGKGLADWHVEVRRRCAATLGAGAATLGRLIADPSAVDGSDDPEIAERMKRERAELHPLAVALRDQGPTLAKALRDGDAEVRLSAQKALDEAATARIRWLRQAGGATDDPLLDGLKAALPALGDAVADGDLRVRRAALDVLEMLGPEAAPATPAMVRALGDPDRFVRWSAIRTLGAIGPPAARLALPGLTRLLDDGDLDVRLAAAAALQRLDPARATPPEAHTVGAAPTSRVARTALPALLRNVRAADPEMRVAAVQTLRGLGTDAKLAVPALREALADSDARVRLAAAEALGALGPPARDAADALRHALKDANPEVRQAAGDALLNVVRPR